MGADSFLAHEGRILSQIKDGVYIVDPNTYELLYVNDIVLKGVGDETGAWQGKKCYEYFRGRTAPCENCMELEQGDHKSHISEQVDTVTGKSYIAKDRCIAWHGREGRLRITLDFTNTRHLRKALEIRMEILDALRDLFEQIADSEAFSFDYAKFLDTIREFYNADAVHMYEMDEGRAYAFHNLNVKTGYSLDTQGNGLGIDKMFDLLTPFFGEGGVVIMDDLEEVRAHSEMLYSELVENDCEVMYTIPLKNMNNVRGYLAVINPKRHKGDLTLMQIISAQIVGELTRKTAWQRQDYQLHHDSLTGLLNRTSYLEYLQGFGELKSLGFLLADINGLKHINTDLGLSHGNVIVKEIADIIKEVFGDYPIFRFGGDDFVVVCTDIEEDKFMELAGALKKRLADHSCGACVGYVWDDFDVDISRMNSQADALLAMEKQRLHENEQEDKYYEHAKVARDIDDLIRNGNFQVYLQPKVRMSTGVYCGAEALIRLIMPKEGVVAPGKFVPFLEKTGVISHVDFFVLDQVCKILVKWQQHDIELIPISLNFSRVSLMEDDFVEHVVKIIEENGAPKDMIELEITESAGEISQSYVSQIAAKLDENGLKLSMDDFGTKYSNLYMISQMPFNSLKLDRSLVGNLEDNETSRKVTGHVVEMCNDLNIQCICEGVETESQAKLLQDMNCDIAQGYLYSRPVPVPEFEEKRTLAEKKV